MGTKLIKAFNFTLKTTIGVWLKYSYNIKTDNKSIKDLKGPFILVANHCLNWDAFIVGVKIKKPVHWIASDSLFRTKTMNWLLTEMVAAIPKKKAKADRKCVVAIIKALRAGDVVGVFPEGRRTWNGETLEIFESTSKLVKLMKVPLVGAKMEGAHLSRPRWSSKGRKGEMQITFKELLSTSDIKDMTVDEITKVMVDGIYTNEYDWQENNMIPYKSKRKAENLEQYLYVCPNCKTIGNMKSEKNDYYCSNCDYSVRVNKYGFLEGEKVIFKRIDKQGEWQHKFMEEYIENEPEMLFMDENVMYRTLDDNGNLTKGDKGKLYFYSDRIEFEHNKQRSSYYLEHITGNNIQLNWIFEFYYENVLKRFKFFPKNKISAFKYNEALKIQLNKKNS